MRAGVPRGIQLHSKVHGQHNAASPLVDLWLKLYFEGRHLFGGTKAEGEGSCRQHGEHMILEPGSALPLCLATATVSLNLWVWYPRKFQGLLLDVVGRVLSVGGLTQRSWNTVHDRESSWVEFKKRKAGAGMPHLSSMFFVCLSLFVPHDAHILIYS